MAFGDKNELHIWTLGKISLSRFGKELEWQHENTGMGFSDQLDLRILTESWNTNSKEPMHPNVHSSTIYSTRLFWLKWPCNTVWYQVQFDIRWPLLISSSFSRLLRLFGDIYGSIYIFEMFVLYLWNTSLVF